MRRWVAMVVVMAGLASAQGEEDAGRGMVPVVEEPADAWLARRQGFKAGMQIGVGLSGLIGVPLSYGFGRVSVYAMPQGQFQWPLLFTTAVIFVGVDAGVLVHFGRYFSVGAGGMIGLFPGELSHLAPGFSVTPAMVHLGSRDQHTLFIYVPVVFNRFQTVPLPMLGYGFRFN